MPDFDHAARPPGRFGPIRALMLALVLAGCLEISSTQHVFDGVEYRRETTRDAQEGWQRTTWVRVEGNRFVDVPQDEAQHLERRIGQRRMTGLPDTPAAPSAPNAIDAAAGTLDATARTDAAPSPPPLPPQQMN